MKHADPTHRRCYRVQLMVHELHKRGFQRLRIGPGMSPSGMSWRCSVTHAGNMMPDNPAMVHDFDRETAHYTSRQDNHYFGWDDAATDHAWQLADKFMERFPAIVSQGRGDDWPYAGWFVRMLGVAEAGGFPVAYSDWWIDPPAGHLLTTESGVFVPMPPSPPSPPPPPGAG